MKRNLLLAVGAVLVLAGCFFRKEKLLPFEPEGRRLGVVMPFSYTASDKAFSGLTGALEESLARALFDTKRLRVIDRQRLNTTLLEQKLPVGVPLDSSQIAAVSKLLKAEVAVYGSIVSAQKESASKKGRVSEALTVTVEAKLVQANTAEVLSSGRATGKSAVRYREGSKPPEEILTNAALTDAADQIAKQLVIELTAK